MRSLVMLLLVSMLSTYAGWHMQPKLNVARRRAAPCAAAQIVLLETQVVTDIDDTVKSSGGIALAGIPLGGVDTSFTRNSFYPGVFQFGLELASYGTRTPNKIAVLTARAREFKWALEIKQSSKLCVRYRQAGEAQNLKDWGVGEVLYGSVAEWVCQERKGWRKFENFKILEARQRKRTRYVFMGDNGKSEKDLEAAQMIIDAFPKEVAGVFLHAVSGETQPAPLPADTEYGGVPVLYFRTYATAAVKAHERKLIDARGARRVIDAVEADMALDTTNIAPGSDNAQLLRAEIDGAHGRLGMNRGLGRLTGGARGLLGRVWRTRARPTADAA